MPKKSVSSEVEVTTLAEPESTSKPTVTFTKWNTFDKAKLAVRTVECATLPGHPGDEACKTNLVPTAENVIRHIGHGGGFIFHCYESNTPWPGWKGLQAAGMEIHMLRDLVDDQEVDIATRALLAVFRPHRPKFRGAYQAFRGQFLINIQPTPPPSQGDDFDDATD